MAASQATPWRHALVAAGLLSVLLFPLAALTILRRGDAPARAAARPQLVR
jgi:hypothetical protein